MDTKKKKKKKSTSPSSSFSPLTPHTAGLVLAAVLALSGCKGEKEAAQQSSYTRTETSPTARPMPPTVLPTLPSSQARARVLIYKMRKDYSQLVPVLMDATRTHIVSYPAPSDLKRGGRLCLPTPLINGYWLDNRGINAQVAFLSYTYEAYSQMPSAPPMDELMRHLVDTRPLTIWHDCGYRSDYHNLTEELNALIMEKGWK